MKTIAVINSANLGLFLYTVLEEWGEIEISEMIEADGHRLSEVSWGVYNEIVDLTENEDEAHLAFANTFLK